MGGWGTSAEVDGLDSLEGGAHLRGQFPAGGDVAAYTQPSVSPQHAGAPPQSRAQTWVSPAETATASAARPAAAAHGGGDRMFV